MSASQSPGRPPAARRLAVVTGATAGIVRELARVLAGEGHDVVVAGADGRVDEVARELESTGVRAHGVRADLATRAGREELAGAVEALGRPVDVLALNAGVGVAGPFVDSGTLEDQLRVVDLDVGHVVHLAHRLVRDMVGRGEGRVLITSSVVATVGAPHQATYSASKAFLQSFAQGLRHELRDTGVTVTALQPGATDTEFWDRSGARQRGAKLVDTAFDDPATVAREGYAALVRGDDHVVPGRPRNRVLAQVGELLPDAVTSRLSAPLTRPRD